MLRILISFLAISSTAFAEDAKVPVTEAPAVQMVPVVSNSIETDPESTGSGSQETHSKQILIPGTNISIDTPCFGITSLQPGVCRSDSACQNTGGRSDGPCALGLGMCCLKPARCGDKPLFGNMTVWASEGYPNPTTSAELCTMIIQKLPGVTQIRIDFDDFEIGGVDESGRCSVDALVFEGINADFRQPRLCGALAGQHIYLPVGKTSIGSQVTLRLILSPGNTPRRFKIRATQIPVISPFQAPPGCLQYYTDPSGLITSFNFEPTKNVGIRNINGLTYAICFRRSPGMCSVNFDPRLPEDSPICSCILQAFKLWRRCSWRI